MKCEESFYMVLWYNPALVRHREQESSCGVGKFICVGLPKLISIIIREKKKSCDLTCLRQLTWQNGW